MRRLTAILVALVACRGDAPAAPATPPPPPCTLELLAGFDPGVPVARRASLPTMDQTLANQTTIVAAIECAPSERDAACRRRAEAELGAAHPEATLSSRIAADRLDVVAHLTIDGEGTEATFASALELERRLAELTAAGSTVRLEAVRREPSAEATRHAIVEAARPPRGDARRTLRVSLVLAPPDDPVGALLALQIRARHAGIALHLVEPHDDGSIEVELGCLARVDDHDVASPTAAPAP